MSFKYGEFGRVRAALLLVGLLLAGCATRQLSPTRATSLREDEIVVIGRIEVLENGERQVFAPHELDRPLVCFRDQAGDIKEHEKTTCTPVGLDGYFVQILPTSSYRLSVTVHSQRSKFAGGKYLYTLYPRFQLSRADPRRAYYVGDLKFAIQISGGKGTLIRGPEECQIEDAEITDNFKGADVEFKRRFPLDTNLELSEWLLSKDPRSKPAMFFLSHTNDIVFDNAGLAPIYIAIWPAMVAVTAAWIEEVKTIWLGPDSKCYFGPYYVNFDREGYEGWPKPSRH